MARGMDHNKDLGDFNPPALPTEDKIKPKLSHQFRTRKPVDDDIPQPSHIKHNELHPLKPSPPPPKPKVVPPTPTVKPPPPKPKVVPPTPAVKPPPPKPKVVPPTPTVKPPPPKPKVVPPTTAKNPIADPHPSHVTHGDLHEIVTKTPDEVDDPPRPDKKSTSYMKYILIFIISIIFIYLFGVDYLML